MGCAPLLHTQHSALKSSGARGEWRGIAQEVGEEEVPPRFTTYKKKNQHRSLDGKWSPDTVIVMVLWLSGHSSP